MPSTSVWNRVTASRSAVRRFTWPSLRGPKAAERRRLARDRRPPVGVVAVGHDVVLEPLRIDGDQRLALVPPIGTGSRRQVLARLVERARPPKLPRRVRLAERLAAHELQRVGLVVAGQRRTGVVELAHLEPELERVAGRRLAHVGHVQAHVVDLQELQHRDWIQYPRRPNASSDGRGRRAERTGPEAVTPEAACSRASRRAVRRRGAPSRATPRWPRSAAGSRAGSRTRSPTARPPRAPSRARAS